MTQKINLGTEREHCLYCHKLMPRSFEYFMGAGLAVKRHDTYSRGYNGHNIFCTLRCGYLWAVGTASGEAPRHRIFNFTAPTHQLRRQVNE